MRRNVRHAVWSALVSLLAMLVVASEESVRRLRILETPEDLALLYADAQTSVTYDASSGRFYYPALGLYLDPLTSMFFSPNSGTCRDVFLQGIYDRPELGGMHYDATSGLYYDDLKMMTYNPATGLYHDWESELDLAYDNEVHAFYDPVAGAFYDRGLRAHLTYDYGTGLFYDGVTGLHYDAERGLYFNRELGFYYDRRRGLYYDTESELYFDPITWTATVDPHRRLRYDEATGCYFCAADGLIYTYDSAANLYCWRDNQMGWRQHYYDPMSGDHFFREGTSETSPYVEERYGNIYDPETGFYFDKKSSTYYYYDSMAECYVDVVNHAPFIPEAPDVPASPVPPPAAPVLFEETGYPGVTREIATGLYWCEYDGRYYVSFDSERELFADDGQSMMGMGNVVYYEPKTGFHLIEDVMSGFFVVQETWDFYDPVCGYFYDNSYGSAYQYDPSVGQFRETMSGSIFQPAWMSWVQWSPPGVTGTDPSSPGEWVVDISNMTYDEYMEMYYDYTRGMYYVPSAALYYDGMSYYDPSTWESYWYDEMLEIYVNSMTGKEYEPPAWAVVNLGALVYDQMEDKYYDASRGMYFDSKVLLYRGNDMYWYDPVTWKACQLDSMSGTFFYVETGRKYVPLVHVVNHPVEVVVPDDPLPDDPPSPRVVDVSAMVYDEALGMYYDAQECLYYDATAGFYYDIMLDCYYDPNTWNCYAYDSLWQVYFNVETGEFYRPYSPEEGYAEDISRMYYDEMRGMYWDPEREMYYVGDADLYYDDAANGYYDPVNWECYHYDGMWQQYLNDDTHKPYVPRPRQSEDVVDTSKMFYDELLGLYYDPEKGLYYDPGVQMYVEARYYDAVGGQYYYDPEGDVYRDALTGEVREAKWAESPSVTVIDLSAMVYDEMQGMYYDYEQGKYYDAAAGLYFDGMHYFNPVTWERCWYDWQRNAYVSESGELYDPDQAGVRQYDGTGRELSDEELAEINATFKVLAQLFARGRETEGMGMERIVELETHYAAPFSAADAVWFYELLGDSSKRVRLRPGVMPRTIEVEVADAWSTMDDGFTPTGSVIPVSQEVWERAVRIPEFTLEQTWNSMAGSLAIMNCNPVNYGSLMDGGMMMGGGEVDAGDAAVIEQHIGDPRYEGLFALAVFRGCWSLTGNGEQGVPSQAGTTIGGLQDYDGDGLSDIEEIGLGTNPLVADTDGDGMNDALEVLIGSDPSRYDCDSDYDGMPDVWETHFGFDPFNPVDGDGDPDHDGLRNFEECALGTNPRNADTDGDGLRDGEELKYGTQPCNPDTDNDQLPDGAEIARGTNPFNPDTDLDGVGDGVEVALGLDPLSVDTDGDGIADSDEVKYGLVGMDMMGKEQLEMVRRLRNWQPLDVEDLEVDEDLDDIPDWLEVFGGSRPFGEFDVFKGGDGFPAVYKLTITLEEPLAKPICLDVNGAKVCLKEARTVTRWCKEGELYTLGMSGPQGTDAKISYTFEDKRYNSSGIWKKFTGLFEKKLPSAANVNEGTRNEGEFFEPSVKILPDPICFHGEGADKEQTKTLRCVIRPEGKAVSMETRWWVSGHEKAEEHLFGPMVNVRREHVGSTVYCRASLSVNKVQETAPRYVQQQVSACHHKDTNAEQVEWCTVHDREKRICLEEGIPQCNPASLMDAVKTKYLPVGAGTSGSGGTGTGSSGAQSPNEYGDPCFTGTHKATSVAYNSDDDNGNGLCDMDDEECVVAEDDLIPLSPIWDGHGACCPCPEHMGGAQVRLSDVHRVGLWGAADKVGRWTDRVVPLSSKVFVEGRQISKDPEDAGFRCTLVSDGQPAESAEPEILDHTFTVFSVRLVPDLTHDDLVDEHDAALVPKMKELGLGWNVTAKRRFAFKLLPEVDLPGILKLKISQGGNAPTNVAVYATKDAETPLIGSNANQHEHLVANRGCTSLEYGCTFWIEASTPGTTATIEAEFTGTGTAAGYDCQVKLLVSIHDFRLAGDGGIHDGTVSFDDPADTNLVFWINDDFDVIRYYEGDFQEDDDSEFCTVDGKVIRNCDDDCIGMVKGTKNQNLASPWNSISSQYCYRDLEDFDRLHLKVDDRLWEKDKLTYEFCFVPEEGKPCPSINLFPAMQEGDLYLRGIDNKQYHGNSAQRNDDRSHDIKCLNNQITAKKLLSVTHEWAELTGDYRYGDINWFLYEGRQAGTGCLQVRVRYGDLIVAEASVRMQLETARAFTEIYQIPDTSITDAKNSDEFQVSVMSSVAQPATASMPGRQDDELVLLVHGWNTKDEEKVTWNDTVFKRLFWHGYRGRVGSFFWPCQRGITDTWDAIEDAPNFDRSEHRAWLSAVEAANRFHQLVQDGTHLTLIVHSQGNVLVGEALRRLSREDKAKITYLAWQGAVSAQMYTQVYDVTIENSGNEMAATHKFDLLIGWGKTKEWWDSLGDRQTPDVFGHYPDGRAIDGPYLNGALDGLRYSINYYNRRDYALNIWLGNHATRPDHLKGAYWGNFSYERCFDYGVGTLYYRQENGTMESISTVAATGIDLSGRFYQKVDGRNMVIYPGNRTDVLGNEPWLAEADKAGIPVMGGETAKWCVFSFVVKSRSLAIGQVPMNGVFRESVDLEDKPYKLTNRHYGHSYEFRSNIQYTWKMWDEIVRGINKR